MTQANPTQKLTAMMELHKTLLTHYIEIEGLPKYPVDLTTKASQKLIKDFLYRAIEELGESYEMLAAILEACEDNSPEEKRRALLELYREELADFHHFITEILIFSNYNEPELIGGVADFLGHDDMDLTGCLLETLVQNGRLYNQDITQMKYKVGRFHHIAYTYAIAEKPRAGGFMINAEFVEEIEKISWAITYFLTKMGNCLKNKAWAQTEKTSNLIQYQEHLIHMLIMLGRLWDALDFKAELIYLDYENKNKINHERIKAKY